MKRQYLPQEKLNYNTTRKALNLHFHEIAGIGSTMIEILLQYVHTTVKFAVHFFSFILTDDTGESKSKNMNDYILIYLS